MQIIPYHDRLRQRLGGLPGLSTDPVEYRKQYIAAYPTKVQPFVGGSRPPQGLRDSDLPRGIKYLDPWAIAEFAQMGRYRSPVELSAWLVQQSTDDENRTRSDSRKFAAWALMRLGAFYPLLTTRPYVPPETEGVGRGSGGNQLRPATEREDTGPKVTPLYDANAPAIFGDDIYALYKEFASLPKHTLAEWVDNVPNWGPWNEWPSRPEAPLALALLWATRVIGERYGIDGSRFLFDARTAKADGEKYAAALNAAFDAELRKGCGQAAKYGGWGFGLVMGALLAAATGGTSLLVSFASGGSGLLAGEGIADLCGKDADEYRRRFIQTIWERLTPEGQFDFVKVVYSARFGVPLQSADKNFDSIIDLLVSQITERNLKSAGDVFAFVARPENDHNIQMALAQARAGLVETIRKTFADTVGCPGNPAFLNTLATRYLDNGWTSQQPIRQLLTDVTPLTKKVASGDYCEPLRSQDPQVAPRKTAPFPSYIDSILGKRGVAPPVPPKDEPTAIKPPAAPAPQTGSALPLALLGAAGGAAVGGPAGAGVGLILGLILGSRKA